MAAAATCLLGTDDFAQIARHPDYPRAFTRNRKLPLPALIGALLSMRNQSQQAMLDGFFASVCGSEFLLREVSDRCGLRVVVGDGSLLMPAVRPCLLSRSSAEPDQRLFRAVSARRRTDPACQAAGAPRRSSCARAPPRPG